MLSLDLFSTKFEKELREGAVDDLEYRRMNDLRDKMEMLMKAYKQADTDEMRSAIMQRYNQYKDEREGYLKIREQQVPSRQDPFAYVKPEPKGIGDIQNPQQKMAQLKQKAKTGPMANVGAGLKAFFKGEPEPMDEQGEGAGPRAYGVANFQRLVKANMGNYPKVEFEFPKPTDNIVLDRHGVDLISDYYDGLENDQAKNHFIYRVLPSADETRKVLKSLGWHEQRQQELPGIPTQGELPLSERQDQKKKSDSDQLKTAGDTKTAREIQKIRAQYPAARSDIEALARAEIDNTERSKEQIGSIRSSNSRQDELLKQIMDIDRQQSQEINSLDSENDSLEQQLARVQSLNDRLAQTMGQMGGKKVSVRPERAKRNTIDLIPGAPADQATPSKTAPAPVRSVPTTRPEPTTSPAMAAMTRTIQGLPKDAPDTAKEPEIDTDVKDKKDQEVPAVGNLRSLRPQQASNVDDFKLVAEGQMKRALDDYQSASEEEFNKKYRMSKQQFYQTVINPKPAKFVAPKTCPQCGRAHESCVCETKLEEAQEIRNKQDYDRAVDSLYRQIKMENNSAVLQMLRTQLKSLQDRGRAEGWHRDRVKEESSTSSDEAESAILKRIMVAHLDLLKEYGPQKVMQAVEEVAYGVGDLDEIGSSDVSGWVDQVKQILGVPEELDEKWSDKYKRSINCANPKGFSQRAHCQGRKKNKWNSKKY